MEQGNSSLLVEQYLNGFFCAYWNSPPENGWGYKAAEIVVGTPERVAEHPTSL